MVGLFLVAILAVQVGWLLAVPPFHGIDEFDHAYRAASVARGDVAASSTPADDGRGYLIRVPADIVAAAHQACSSLAYTGPDNCSPVGAPDASGATQVASAAATYNPAWYAMAGTAALPFEGDEALLAMRLVSLAVCDALIAGALWLLLGRTRSSWALLGMAAATTPVLVYSSTVAAPNGVGYSAGLLLWAGLVTLSAPERHPRGAMAAVAIGGGLVMLTHSTGPLWVVAALLCALPMLAPPLRLLWTQHRARLLLTAGLLLVAAIACASWVLASSTNDPRAEAGGDHGPARARTLLQGVVLWPLQSFATLRMRDDAAPIGVYAIGVAVIVILVGVGLRASTRAARLSIALVATTSLAIPMAATVLAHPHLGPAWQGRYGLPLASGVVLIATWSLARGSSGPAWFWRFVVVGAVAVAHGWTVAAAFALELPHATGGSLVSVLVVVVAFVAMSAAFRLLSASRQ